jgi:sugar porter (SP) family MFS transporter
VAAVGFILGVVIMASAPNYGLLMVGRFFVGLGVGVGLAIDPLYIAEVSPPEHRGELVTWSEIALNVGLVFGFSTGLTLSGLPDDLEWRVMFLLGAILPAGMIVLVFTVMPESPRWLVARQRPDEAADILRRVYPPGHDVSQVVEEIREALEREEEAEHAVGWKVLTSPTPAIRRMLLVGVGIAVAQQAVGIDAIQYYLLDVLQQSGIENEAKLDWTLIFLGLIKLAFILVGGRMFDQRGRRPPFFISLLGTAASTLVIGAAFLAAGGNPSGRFVVGGLGFYLAFFSIGMGPGAWLIPSEIFASCIRAKAMSVATFANRVTATLMSSTFLSTANAVGWGGFFLMLSAVSLIVLGFVRVYLPETKGKSLEEMSVYFAEITNDTFVLDAEAKIAERRRREVEMGNPPSRRNDAEVI